MISIFDRLRCLCPVVYHSTPLHTKTADSTWKTNGSRTTRTATHDDSKGDTNEFYREPAQPHNHQDRYDERQTNNDGRRHDQGNNDGRHQPNGSKDRHSRLSSPGRHAESDYPTSTEHGFGPSHSGKHGNWQRRDYSAHHGADANDTDYNSCVDNRHPERLTGHFPLPPLGQDCDPVNMAEQDDFAYNSPPPPPPPRCGLALATATSPTVYPPPTLRASLPGTFLQTLPDLVTHSLSPRSCPATRSAPSERFRYLYD